MRIRVAGIIKLNEGFALMHRKNVKNKPLSEYYTFPGGGLEENETLEEGVVREIKEEFGIDVKPIRLIYEKYAEDLDQKEYYFLCKYIKGDFGTGDGPEYNSDPKYIDSGNFIPEIVEPSRIKNIPLMPPDIAKIFIEDINENKF